MRGTLSVPSEPLGRGLSMEEIAAGERRLGARLPEAYAALLSVANGLRLHDVVVRPTRGGPALEVRILSGIRPPGSGVAPEDLAGYNAYYTVAKGSRPERSFAFAHAPRGSFVLFHAGARSGEVAFVERATRAITRVAASFEDFLARLEARAAPATVAHASSRRRPADAPTPPVAAPRRAETRQGADLRASRLPAGAVVRDARMIDCTFGGASCDARSFTTFERVALVRPTVTTRLVMNLVCRDVVVDGSKTGTKPLSLVNVLCARVRLVGDHGRLFFRADPEHLPKGDERMVATFYDDVPWALDIREGRFRELTLRGYPAHLVLRDPARHAVVLGERLAADPAWRRLDPGLVAVLQHALESPDDCHFLCASDSRPRGSADREQIAALRAMGLVD